MSLCLSVFLPPSSSGSLSLSLSRKMAVDIQTVCFLHTDVDIVIQTVIQTVGIYHTDVQTVDI